MYSLFCFSFKHVRCIQRFQLLYELLHATFNILIMNYVSSRDKSVLLQLSLQNSIGLHVRLYNFEYHIHCSLSNAILCILLIGLQILSCRTVGLFIQLVQIVSTYDVLRIYSTFFTCLCLFYGTCSYSYELFSVLFKNSKQLVVTRCYYARLHWYLHFQYFLLC